MPARSNRAQTSGPPADTAADDLRLDKWLWAARLFKTRSLAAEAVQRGLVLVNEQAAKPSRDLRVGDVLSVRQASHHLPRVVVIRGLSAVRRSAPQAQALYEETEASRLAREADAERRRLAPEPALAIEQGRPTKRERRDLADWRRWSASLDDERG